MRSKFPHRRHPQQTSYAGGCSVPRQVPNPDWLRSSEHSESSDPDNPVIDLRYSPRTKTPSVGLVSPQSIPLNMSVINDVIKVFKRILIRRNLPVRNQKSEDRS